MPWQMLRPVLLLRWKYYDDLCNYKYFFTPSYQWRLANIYLTTTKTTHAVVSVVLVVVNVILSG